MVATIKGTGGLFFTHAVDIQGVPKSDVVNYFVDKMMLVSLNYT